jgi:DNA-binding NarL/FixJ family response regulator
MADLCPPAPEPLLAAPGLSEEELEVLRLLAQGEGPRGIARGLGFSRRAARGMVAGLVERLGARSPAQAVARAVREGVI